MGEIDVRWPLALRIAGVLGGIAWAVTAINGAFNAADSGGAR